LKPSADAEIISIPMLAEAYAARGQSPNLKQVAENDEISTISAVNNT